MLYAFPSFNHLGALDICVVHWDLIPLECNPVNALIIDVTRVGNEEEEIDVTILFKFLELIHAFNVSQFKS